MSFALALRICLGFSFRQRYTKLGKQHIQFLAAGVGKRNAPAVFVAAYLSFAAKALAQVAL